MARAVLANAFALSMLSLPEGGKATVIVERLDIDTFVAMAKEAFEAGRLECAIGHTSTAELVAGLLAVDAERLGCKRVMVKLEPGDELYAVVLSFRPPEGKVYTTDELLKLYHGGAIQFYRVSVESVET